MRRFVSRRGKPTRILSDNGTNFIGAKGKLKELSKFLRSKEKTITDLAICEDINWSFSPSYSAHFGGLWERAIRSAKHHLRRIIGKVNLTFEEFCTILCQIEAVLNSRPITLLSSDCNDLNPLTPGHFLIGRALKSVPDFDLTDAKTNLLSRYQLLQKLHFWQRWSREYLQLLQPRNKWHKNSVPLVKDSIVLLKQNNLPPLSWRLGRVIDLHAGKDGVPRVASVVTSTGTFRHAVANLSPLPLNDMESCVVPFFLSLCLHLGLNDITVAVFTNHKFIDSCVAYLCKVS